MRGREWEKEKGKEGNGKGKREGKKGNLRTFILFFFDDLYFIHNFWPSFKNRFFKLSQFFPWIFPAEFPIEFYTSKFKNTPESQTTKTFFTKVNKIFMTIKWSEKWNVKRNHLYISSLSSSFNHFISKTSRKWRQIVFFLVSFSSKLHIHPRGNPWRAFQNFKLPVTVAQSILNKIKTFHRSREKNRIFSFFSAQLNQKRMKTFFLASLTNEFSFILFCARFSRFFFVE